MQRIKFSKMHGLGNDFVVIDAITQEIHLSPEQIRFIADRHFGIGCDQVLLVGKPLTQEADFGYRIFNADGGNGARCFAHFVHDQGLSNKDEIAVETKTGIIYPRFEKDGRITVNMGAPRFDPASLPFDADGPKPTYHINHQGEEITIGAVSMGNPHAVYRVRELDMAPVKLLGPAISTHPSFPNGVNVGFMQIVSRDHIRLRVYERGAGETLACGTGACAAMVIGRSWGELDDTVKVDLPGGQLLIRWLGDNQPVWMTGPATHVFEGTIEL